MADSAPDQKVEDVLSSVRRLVSQELPKRQGSKAAETPAGALVLTSEDRIETDPTARVETRSLEQRIAELEAAVDNTSLEFEPDGSEDQSLHRPDRIVYTRPRPSEEEARRPRSTLRLSEIALIETGPANEGEEEEDAPVAFRHGASEAPMAEDVPTLPAASAELHAFSDPDDVVARIEARIERGETESQPNPAASSPSNPDVEDKFDAALNAAVAASLSPDDPAAVEAAADDADTLKADEVDPPESSVDDRPAPAEPPISRAAELTRLAMPAVDAFELTDDGASGSEHTSDPHDSRALADEVPNAIPAPEKKSAAGADIAAVDTVEAALRMIPDEDAMRLLVSRLMREELRGELGERITRNVRKLVHREMMRVLETRKLD